MTLNESETRSVNLALFLFYALMNNDKDIESCNSVNRVLNPKTERSHISDLLNAINALIIF